MKTLTKILLTFAITVSGTLFPNKLNYPLSYFTRYNSNVYATTNPKKDDLESKILELQEKIRHNQNNLESHFDLGTMYFIKDDFNNAEIEFEKVIQLDPGCSMAYTKLGIISGLRGENNKAIEFMKKGIEVDPANPFGYYGLGNQYLKQEKPEEARIQFNKMLEIDPNNPRAMIGIAGSYAESDPNRAISLTKKALKLDPNIVEGHSTLGLLYFKKGDFSNAEKEFENAVEIIPHPYFIVLRDGTRLIQQKKYEQAAKIFENVGRRYNDLFLIDVSEKLKNYRLEKAKENARILAKLITDITFVALLSYGTYYVVKKRRKAKVAKNL